MRRVRLIPTICDRLPPANWTKLNAAEQQKNKEIMEDKLRKVKEPNDSTESKLI